MCVPEACNFIKKDTLAKVFSCEFCENSKRTFFTKHLLKTASASISTISVVLLVLKKPLTVTGLH